MLNETKYYCPECDEGFDLPEVRSRRDFLRAIGATAALATAGTTSLRAAESKPKPAEELIRELYSTLSADQKTKIEAIQKNINGNHDGNEAEPDCAHVGVRSSVSRDRYSIFASRPLVFRFRPLFDFAIDQK